MRDKSKPMSTETILLLIVIGLVAGVLSGMVGVGGGIIAVVNRQLGIAVYSPRLDSKGNSVRGILACKELASHLGLHAFEFTNVGSNFMQWLSS